MRVENQSSTIYLLRLAFRSAKFNPRQALTSLLLIFIFATGALYITSQIIYQRDKVKLSSRSNSESTKGRKPVQAGKPSFQSQEFYIPLKLRQERRRKAVAQLKSKLQLKSLGRFETELLPRKQRSDAAAAEKLARHEAILTQPLARTKSQLQEKQLYAEEDVLPASDEEEVLPPSKRKSSFLWKIIKEIRRDIQKFYHDLFHHEPIEEATR